MVKDEPAARRYVGFDAFVARFVPGNRAVWRAFAADGLHPPLDLCLPPLRCTLCAGDRTAEGPIRYRTTRPALTRINRVSTSSLLTARCLA